MKKQFQKGTEEFMMFADFYELCKRFWIPEDTDEYWEELVTESQKFSQKYDSVYARHFAQGLIGALEEVNRKEKS